MPTKRLIQFASLLVFSALFGCATEIQKAPVAANADPTQEIDLLDQQFRQAGMDHVDVLAPDDYKESETWLKEAKGDLAAHESRDELLDDVAYSRAYLNRASSTADERRPQISAILEARAAALKAGVHSNKELSHEMRRLDEQIADNSKNLSKNLTTDDFAKLQGAYLGLELKALQNKYLASANMIIHDSIKNEHAERRAPNALKRAQNDVAAAENAIAVSRSDVPGFSGAVITANTSAQMLREVLTAMNNNNKIDEAAAYQLVRQDHQISKLQGTLGAAESDMEDMDARMRSQQRRLSSAQTAVGLQKSIEKAQQSFDKDEAEVFQQGNDQLVIRLKKMAFVTGSSQLPQASLPLLSKVENVIADLNSKEVSVEGHTDSTGSEKQNLALSQKRADIVADYLRENASSDFTVTAKGFGFSRPIADNKTKEGRAQNRRVDVVIKAAPGNDSQLTEL